MHIRGLTLSILLTAVLASCGGKKMNSQPLILPYGENGLIVAAIVDPAPVSDSEKPYTPGERLLQTQWGQGTPFNDALPLIDGERPVIGCVNTGMAQMLYYYRYPTKARGIVAGELAGQEAWADLNTPINWNHITTDHRQLKAKYQREEIAQLLRNMAIVNKTTLALSSQGGSGTITAKMIENLVKHYGFADTTKTIKTTVAQPNQDFVSALMHEIDNKRPVFLSLNGTLNHLVIADGYKIEDEEVLFHLNMGWQGLHDGFYSLNMPVQVIEEFTRGGSRWQRTLEADSFVAYTGIQPCPSGESCFVNLEEGDHQRGNILEGRLGRVGDSDTYGPFAPDKSVKLDISGRTTAAFYITVLDEFQRPLMEANRDLTFEPRIPYYIRVGTHSQISNSYFNYESSYRIKIEKTFGPFETLAPRELQLKLSEKEIILGPDESIVVRASVVPYAPESIFYRVVDEQDTLVGAVTDNLIKLDGQNLSTERLNRLRVQAYKDEHNLISETELKILVHQDSFSFGKNQQLLGRFESTQQDISFKAVLDGECSINGKRGFSNQAFFIEVADLPRSEETLNHTFSKGIYDIKASLRMGHSVYAYDPSKADFQISIACPNAEHGLEELVELF